MTHGHMSFIEMDLHLPLWEEEETQEGPWFEAAVEILVLECRWVAMNGEEGLYHHLLGVLSPMVVMVTCKAIISKEGHVPFIGITICHS